MNHPSRRTLLGALCLGFAGLAGTAQAQTYPAKATTLIVGFAPGGSADIIARIVAQELTASLGHPVIVDNRPGAAGAIASTAVAAAPADGYTLLLSTAGIAGSNALFPKLKYDTLKSFAPVANLGASPIVVVVPAASPFKSINDVLAAARKAPGKLNYAAGGGGATTPSMAAEFLKSETKTSMQLIPYKGSAPALVALAAGELDLAFDIPSSALPLVQSGRLRAIAVTTKKRSSTLADVPTVAETVAPGFEVTGWFGVMAPAGTPAEVIARLNKDINAALAKPAVHERLLSLGVEHLAGTPAAFGHTIASEVKRYSEAIRTLGIKAD